MLDVYRILIVDINTCQKTELPYFYPLKEAEKIAEAISKAKTMKDVYPDLADGQRDEFEVYISHLNTGLGGNPEYIFRDGKKVWPRAA